MLAFAAEHGVGIVKPAEMERYRSAVELDLMRGFKRLLDPDGLHRRLLDPDRY